MTDHTFQQHMQQRGRNGGSGMIGDNNTGGAGKTSGETGNGKKINRGTARTLAEWIAYYEESLGEKMDVPGGFEIYYLPERGFAFMRPVVDDSNGVRTVFVYHVCGDARFWRDVAELMAMQNRLTAIITYCVREILPYIRFFHWQIMETYELGDDGSGRPMRRYVCRDMRGRRVVCTFHHVNDVNDKPVYTVSQELDHLYGERDGESESYGTLVDNPHYDGEKGGER